MARHLAVFLAYVEKYKDDPEKTNVYKVCESIAKAYNEKKVDGANSYFRKLKRDVVPILAMHIMLSENGEDKKEKLYGLTCKGGTLEGMIKSVFPEVSFDNSKKLTRKDGFTCNSSNVADRLLNSELVRRDGLVVLDREKISCLWPIKGDGDLYTLTNESDGKSEENYIVYDTVDTNEMRFKEDIRLTGPKRDSNAVTPNLSDQFKKNMKGAGRAQGGKATKTTSPHTHPMN